MRRWLILVLKFGSLFSTIGLPALVAYGIAVPWPAADEALSQFGSSHKLLVGFAYASRFRGDRTFESKSQMYILLPLRNFATVQVTKDDLGVRTDIQPFGAVMVAAGFLIGAIGVWWFFVRPYLHATNRNGRA